MPFMLKLGWALMIIAGVAMVLGEFIFGVNLWAILIPVFLSYFGVTFIWPSAFGSAMTPFGHIAGYAGALYSTIQLSSAAVLGTIIAKLPETSQLPLGVVFIISPLLA